MILCDAFCRFATFLTIMLVAGQVAADPITVRGINWAMSETERVAALESQGLACEKEIGWDEFPPRSEKLGELDPAITCILSKNNEQKFHQLRSYFKTFVNICDKLGADGYVTSDCIGYNKFRNLRDSAVKVRFKDSNTIVFSCHFLGTCGFDWSTIVHQLRKKVIDKDFVQPTKDSFVICSDGNEGDSICLHGFSKDIWLLRQPLGDTMKF